MVWAPAVFGIVDTLNMHLTTVLLLSVSAMMQWEHGIFYRTLSQGPLLLIL